MNHSTVHFPEGLPGFESCRRFVVVTSPSLEPFCALQGQGPDAPAFVAIDPRHVAPEFSCALEATDRARLLLSDDQAATSSPLLWLALVTATEQHATVNLRAPIVINPQSMRGVQVVPAASDQPIAFSLSEGAA